VLGLKTNKYSLTAQRNQRDSTRSVQKRFRNLSSGSRISRSGDDAAGLAVSENIDSFARSQRVAMRNANDGISIVQTMEGGVEEVSNLLMRMRELAVQSSSETLANEERAYLNDEFTQLQGEIGRIREVTTFNGNTLLNGTWLDGKDIQIGGGNTENDRIAISVGDVTQTQSVAAVASVTTGKLGVLATVQGDFEFGAVGSIAGGTATLLDRHNIATESISAGFASGSSAIARAAAINAGTGAHGVTATVHKSTYESPGAITAGTFGGSDRLWFAGGKTEGSVNIGLGGLTVQNNDSDSSLKNHVQTALDGKYGSGIFTVDTSSGKVAIEASDGRTFRFDSNDAAGLAGMPTTGYQNGVGSITLTSANDFEYRATNAGDWGVSGGTQVVAATGGSSSVDLTDNGVLNVSSVAGARSALETLDIGLMTMNGHRSKLGAIQNRLQSSLHHLSSSSENLSHAKSRIADADFAFETAALSKAEVMQNVSTALLAQGNQLPQVALRLIG
jgi:flagellin